MEISVIIPCYNALGKIERCLAALQQMDIVSERYEVIFVDDCSSDGTYEYLTHLVSVRHNWRVERLVENSGSPSKPRNIGIEKAQGSYIFFLDCDDEILPDTLSEYLKCAIEKQACVVRGDLIADDGVNQIVMNQIANWHPSLNKKERIELIISRQSSIPCSLIRKALLIGNSIQWQENIRIGEDSCFLVDTLLASQNIEYISHPTYIYNKKASFTASSTQRYGALELENHLFVWEYLRRSLLKIGLDYYPLRLNIGLKTAFSSLVYHNKHDIQESLFKLFSDFIIRNKVIVESFAFNTRNNEIKNSLLNSDYEYFCQICKPRLLIAGYDLKFVRPTLDKLSKFYAIKIDEWTGHNEHSLMQSEEMLEWADYIWCEWLLGNAVWYSQRKKYHQKLIVRMHRFELGREFGEQVNIANVDAVVAVSLLFFERLIERFPNIPREKVRLIHNYVDIEGYDQSDLDDRQFNFALIGIVPYRKGLHHALEILKQLKAHDSRYKLKIFGTNPKDIPWLQKHDVEMNYYRECDEFITQYGLKDDVAFLGHCNIKSELAANNVGYVLSLSENTQSYPGPESFHLAIADGFAAGALSLILKWDGSEYIYPANFIKESIDSIVNTIIKIPPNSTKFVSQTELGKQLLINKYSIDEFILQFNRAFNDI
jgi:poly(ribitol-phosphate) beta-N-acetylglucosaminyltransferase